MLRRVAKAILPSSIKHPIEHWIGQRNDRKRVIDLRAAAVLRTADDADLRDPERLAALLCDGGLNDEILDQFPLSLHPYAGRGLRLWQLPIQFAPYLVELSRHQIRRYLEIGVRHGGSFVATVEYLARIGELEEAVAVDIEAVPSLLPYPLQQPSVRLMQADTLTSEFEGWVGRHPGFDLAFVDGLHSYEACRRDFETVRKNSRLIAMHDISNAVEPSVGRVWRQVREEYSAEFEFREFTAQHPEVPGPTMGIGLAIRRGEGA